MKTFSRKDFLVAGGIIGTGLLMPEFLQAQTRTNTSKKRLLRVAHITDVHVQPEGAAPKGMANCLHEIQQLADKPDFIVNTGDAIMDALSKEKSRVKAQWNTWNSVLANENSMEIFHCIGNHDIWGWSGLSARRTDEHYGKQWATEMFGIKNRFYSFDKNGWHFVVLDSMTHVPFGYTAKLDGDQFDWLKEDLARTPQDTFVCILSHIPILSASVFFDGSNVKQGKWKIPGAWMHQDAGKLKNLFLQHKNVKAALSGHIHLIDEVAYNGVNYYCNGAVSGGWWGGNYQEFPPAFCVMNFYDDGSTEREVYYHNWKA
ncbi:MAG: metallophosphoesterase [Chitinophagales bacterium]